MGFWGAARNLDSGNNVLKNLRAALGALGLALPPKRITVNLVPADLLKEGSHFDLPIALGLLVAMGVLPEDEIAALGELTLDGRVNPVAGVLLAAMHALEHVNGNECHLMAKRGKAL